MSTINSFGFCGYILLVCCLFCFASDLPNRTKHHKGHCKPPFTNQCGPYQNKTAQLFVDSSDGSEPASYLVPWFPQMNVHLAMHNLHSTENDLFQFDASSETYPYGFSVKSINQLAASNEDRTYWALYIDGAQSGCGISTALVPKNGNITFKYSTY